MIWGGGGGTFRREIFFTWKFLREIIFLTSFMLGISIKKKGPKLFFPLSKEIPEFFFLG